MRTLSEAADRAPDAPGVYFLLGHDGELLYVGKAGRLRRRLRQHADQKPFGLSRRQLTLYQLVRSVRWEEHPDELSAADREADLIVALQPRFNASYRDQGRWNYVVVRPVGSRKDAVRLELSAVGAASESRAYGCFAHLGRGVSSPVAIACSDGYTATLRLLWAASSASASTFPSRITRSAPDTFEVGADPSCQALLHRFLSGTSLGLLAELSARSSARPEYLQPSLVRDRRAAAAFYARGPLSLRRLRRRHDRPPGPLTRDTIVALLLDELHDSIGEFEPPRNELC